VLVVPERENHDASAGMAMQRSEAFANVPSTKRKLQGASLLDFSRREIKVDDTLLGNRFLCRGGGCFIIAPSGHGKSTLAVQAAIELL
jgi:hypothetical protein